MKEYIGTTYIGVVGPDTDIGACRDSIHQIIIRAGDRPPQWIRATKGYEARQMHLNKWYGDAKHEFLLLLDHDMIFPPDTLEKLRAHKLPFVSGYYLRRQYKPIAPVWLKTSNTWPMIPFVQDPDPKVLHELGASGWGCILLHRDVVTATKSILKGENEIIEDDMDVWPYDLPNIIGAVRGLRELHDLLETGGLSLNNIRSILNERTRTLENEIRPLRGCKSVVGSDIRYPFFARKAGFKLYGDASVRCGHNLNYPLDPNDFSNTPQDYRNELEKEVKKDVADERKRIRAALEGLK